MAAALAIRSCCIWLSTDETRLSWVIWSTGTTTVMVAVTAARTTPTMKPRG